MHQKVSERTLGTSDRGLDPRMCLFLAKSHHAPEQAGLGLVEAFLKLMSIEDTTI